MEPDWNDFKVLLALGRGGSIAGAARVLEVDHSTVSRRLAAMEEAFGAKLLIRGGREFGWTDEGRTALAAAEAVELAILDATRCIQTAKSDAVGVVRVSVPPAFSISLMPLLNTAGVKHPQLDIQLLSAFQRADLAKGEADIAIRMARPDQPSLVGRRALDCGWALYAATAYSAKHGHLKSIDELREHQLVLYAEIMHNAEPLRWMENYRCADTRFTRVDSIESATQVLLTGYGIGLLPHFIGECSLGLERVFPEPVTSNTGWIVYHESLRNTARVRTVVDLLAAYFGEQKTFFSGRRNDESDATTAREAVKRKR